MTQDRDRVAEAEARQKERQQAANVAALRADTEEIERRKFRDVLSFGLRHTKRGMETWVQFQFETTGEDGLPETSTTVRRSLDTPTKRLFDAMKAVVDAAQDSLFGLETGYTFHEAKVSMEMGMMTGVSVSVTLGPLKHGGSAKIKVPVYSRKGFEAWRKLEWMLLEFVDGKHRVTQGELGV